MEKPVVNQQFISKKSVSGQLTFRKRYVIMILSDYTPKEVDKMTNLILMKSIAFLSSDYTS